MNHSWCLSAALLISMFLACADPAYADNVRHFTANSYNQIEQARAGKPFVLAFWSVSCSHCPSELRALARLQRQYPQLEIVLVATDTPQDAADASHLAAEYGLAGSEQWIFADEVPERLRFAIDRRWHGELPRTYFFDGRSAPAGVSGVIPPEKLEAWVIAHTR